MNGKYFKVDLSKTQIDVCIALLRVRAKLGGWYSLPQIADITHLDYIGSLFRERKFFFERRILIANNEEEYRVCFENIAYLLGTNSEFKILFWFFQEYLEPPRKLV